MESNVNEKTMEWLKQGVSAVSGWWLVALGLALAVFGYFQLSKKDENEAEQPIVQDVEFTEIRH